MHSTKVLVCKQACRTLAVQHASYIVPGKGGMHQRGERAGESTRTREKRETKGRVINSFIHKGPIYYNSELDQGTRDPGVG